MSNCLNCGKPLENVPGRRAKMYCDSNCRTTHWQKKHRVAGVERVCLVASADGLWETTDGKKCKLVWEIPTGLYKG